jgi:translation initiation factor IF-2
MSEVNTPRLMAAAKEFNIGKDTLIDFLVSKGFNSDDLKPTSKLAEDMYRVLQTEFQQDKAAKQKAEQIDLPKNATAEQKKKRDEEDISIRKKEAAKIKETPPPPPPPAPVEEPKVEVKKEEIPEPVIPELTKIEAPEIVQPKVINKIDLSAIDSSTRPKKETQPAAKADKEEKPKKETTKKPKKKEEEAAPVDIIPEVIEPVV